MPLWLTFLALNLPGDFKSQVQRAFAGFAADDGRLLFADAVNKTLQFQLERFVLRNRHRLAHDSFAGKFADHRHVAASKGQKLSQLGTDPLIVAGDAVNETFLRAVIERDIADDGAAAEDAMSFPVIAVKADSDEGTRANLVTAGTGCLWPARFFL